MSNVRTPSPWRLESKGWDGQFIYGNDARVGNGERFIAQVSLMYNGAEANAEFIVRACNSHDALVAALNDIADAGDDAWGEDRPCVRVARAALAAAGAA